MGAGFVLLFILVLLLGALVTGIALWATSGSGGSGEMACGACGYAVRGLTQMNCPECGVDLREAGINRPGSLGRKVAGRLLVFASLSVFVMGLLATVLFSVRSSPPSSTPIAIPTPAPAQPTSGSTSPNGAEPDSSEPEDQDGSEEEAVIPLPDTSGGP